MGERFLWLKDRSRAGKYFRSSLTYYRWFPAEAAAEREVYRRLYDIAYMDGDFPTAPADLDKMERSPHQVPPQSLAQLLACRADVLVQLGRYREADQLYARWRAAGSSLSSGARLQPILRSCPHDLRPNAVDAGTFCRSWRAAGAGQCVLENSVVTDPWYLFEILLARAELALQLADYRCANDLLLKAQAVGVAVTPHFSGVADREARWLIASGRRHLALGRYAAAREQFCEAQKLIQARCPARLLIWVAATLGLARTESSQSSLIEAERQARNALARLEASKTTGLTLEMAWTLHELAFVYIQDERPEEAEPICRRAIELVGISLRSGHPSEVDIRITLAKSLLSQHHPDEAEERCTAAAALLRQFSPCDWFQENATCCACRGRSPTRSVPSLGRLVLELAHNLWVARNWRWESNMPRKRCSCLI